MGGGQALNKGTYLHVSRTELALGPMWNGESRSILKKSDPSSCVCFKKLTLSTVEELLGKGERLKAGDQLGCYLGILMALWESMRRGGPQGHVNMASAEPDDGLAPRRWVDEHGWRWTFDFGRVARDNHSAREGSNRRSLGDEGLSSVLELLPLGCLREFPMGTPPTQSELRRGLTRKRE